MANEQEQKTLTLRELRDRLTEIIDNNERHGWDERNDLPFGLSIKTGKSWRTQKTLGVRFVSSSMISFGSIADRRSIIEGHGHEIPYARDA